MKHNRIIFASGGTGGHLYPAFAVAEEIRRTHPGWEFLFVGRKRGFGEQRVMDWGYDFLGIHAKGWDRKKTCRNITVPFVMMSGTVRIFFHLLCHRPAAVLGTGGYVSAPTLLCAKILRIPIAVQEQNAFPGAVTRWAAQFANRVFLANNDAAKYLKKTKGKVMTLGMPIRPITAEPKQNLHEKHGFDKEKPVFLVFGGSQGSSCFNRWMRSAYLRILKETDAQIIWQTGDRDWPITLPDGSLNDRIRVMPYLDPIYDYLRIADTVLCRSGASTVAEITVFGIPAVMVPFPYATDDHQRKNAEYLAKNGAGFCLHEKETTAEKMAETVIGLLRNQNQRKEMSARSKELGQPEAAARTAEEFIRMIEEV